MFQMMALVAKYIYLVLLVLFAESDILCIGESLAAMCAARCIRIRRPLLFCLI